MSGGGEDFVAFDFSSPEPEKEATPQLHEDGLAGRKRHPGGTDQQPPWIRVPYADKEIASRLHAEILDYAAWVRPHFKEHEIRLKLIERVSNCVKGLWPSATTHVFGSVATGLYLPGGDIDLVLLSKEGNLGSKKDLYRLAQRFTNQKIAASTTVIASANVPIVKFIDAETNISVDISFEKTNGVTIIDIIQNWLRDYPGLENLILVLKAVLRERSLSEVFSGGLGSFSVICLLVSFLQIHPRVASGQIKVADNLGVLLLEFLELYGKKFNYSDLTVLPLSGSYMRKPIEFTRPRQPYLLSIEDPLDATNDISKSSREILRVRTAFSGVFDILISRMYIYHRNGKAGSILSAVLEMGYEREREEGIKTQETMAMMQLTSELSKAEANGVSGKRKRGLKDELLPNVVTVDSDDEYEPGQPFVMHVEPEPGVKKGSSDSIITAAELKGVKETEEIPSSSKHVVVSSDEESRTDKIKKKRKFWKGKGSSAVVDTPPE